MGYSIPSGYASIYCQTWFGLYQNIKYSIPIDLDCLLQIPPFDEDLVFDWPSRVDGTLETYERISDGVDNGEIVGGEVALFTGLNGESVSTGFNMAGGQPVNLEFSINVSDLGGKRTILSSSAEPGTEKGIYIYAEFDRFKIGIQDGTSTQVQILFSGNIVIDTLYNCVFDWNGLIGGTVSLTVNGVTESYVASYQWAGNSSRTIYIGSIAGNLNEFFGVISGVKYNDIFDYSLNGHLINAIDGNSASWFAGGGYSLLNKGLLPTVKSALNNGYYHETATGKQVINPQYPLPVGWVAYPGGEDIFHNGINSFLSTNPLGSVAAKFDILDRINQTTASTDSIYYDATDRISRSKYYVGLEANELNYDVIQTYLQIADKDKLFLGLNANYDNITDSFRFFTYATQKTGADLTDVLIYIKYLYFFAGLVFYYASNSQYIPVIF
jgi:hypothetical protein